MYRNVSMALITGTVLLAMSAGAQAAPLYKWCVAYNDMGHNCGFITYQQCKMTADGMGGYCALSSGYIDRNPNEIFITPTVM